MLIRESDPKHRSGQHAHDRSLQLQGLFGIHKILTAQQRGEQRILTGCAQFLNGFCSFILSKTLLNSAHAVVMFLPVYLRLLANERRPPPPPPYVRGRSSRGRASLSVNGRPLNSWPLSAFIAAVACVLSLMVTNANPRDLPVIRSIIRRPSLTW